MSASGGSILLKEKNRAYDYIHLLISGFMLKIPGGYKKDGAKRRHNFRHFRHFWHYPG
jgi:hypothetical protein